MPNAAVSIALPLLLRALAPGASDPLARFQAPAKPERIEGRGQVVDSSHPMRPWDARTYATTLRLESDPELGELVLDLTAEGEPLERWLLRRGRVFQVDEQGKEVAAHSFGELSPAAIAALHPRAVASALSERRAAWSTDGSDAKLVFAWNDALWRVELDPAAGRVLRLERPFAHPQYGDRTEEIRFEEWPQTGSDPRRVVVRHDDVEVARFEYAAATDCEPPVLPDGDRERDPVRAVSSREIRLEPVADHLYSIDLASQDTRITVAEFADHLVVLEGCYDSRICDLVARAVTAELGKPVRLFAFSHLHGQYLGGVRSWIHAGATVLVPPTTAPLIEALARAPFQLEPDALAAEPREPEIRVVDRDLHLEDAANLLVVYAIESEHTDEYLIFYFPRQRILLSGDLLFYRPGQGLTGRSLRFARTVTELGLEFDTVRCTWPLDGYGTKNVVTRDELRAALDASQ
jgi:hypothetical protein